MTGGFVSASVPDGAGGFYIGGAFGEVGGQPRKNIAHILADGSVDPAFDPGADDTVLALAVSGSTVYAGGWFTQIGGQPRSRIAALDATTGNATSWQSNVRDYSLSRITAIAVIRGRIHRLRGRQF